ncbi:MAG: hypothetical protein AAF718_17560 [Pseudomonadota bacterium]
MRRVLTAVCSLLFLASTSLAQPQFEEPLATILDDLAAGEFEQVEETFLDLHQLARETRDYRTLRRVYSELFESPQRDRVRFTRAWLEAQPDSLYANTAMAWIHHGRSALFRDQSAQSATSREGHQKFTEEIEKATVALRRAHKADPTFPPALDAALRVTQMKGQLIAADPILDRLFDEAPDADTLRRALNTYTIRWGHSGEKSRALCEKYADRVPNYTTDTCYILFVFLNDLKNPREQAAELLAEETDPSLDWIRRKVYEVEWLQHPEAEKELIRLQREGLDGRASLGDQIQSIEWINQVFDRPFYAAEALKETVTHFYGRYQLHPQNYRLADSLLRQFHDNPKAVKGVYTAHDIARTWPEMQEMGKYSGYFWRFSAYLVQAVANPYALDAQSDFYANAIYYGNHHNVYLSSATRHYHWLYQTAPKANERYPQLDRDPKS